MGHNSQFWDKDWIDFSSILDASFPFNRCHIHSRHMTLNSVMIQILNSDLILS